jgi:putative phage-type endonuclease
MTDDVLVQGTDAWRSARCGSLGASEVHEAIAKTKSGYSASRANKMASLIIERITGVPLPTFQSAAMATGTEREPDARAAYCFRSDADVKEVGLFRHPTMPGTHASPDGLIGDDGLLEIKCPQPAAHLSALLGEPIPDRYIVQMLWQMRCADRQWADYVSYNPDFPESMKLLVTRVNRDDARLATIEKEVSDFLVELNSKVKSLQEKFGMQREAA